jgi:hypothetical protein
MISVTGKNSLTNDLVAVLAARARTVTGAPIEASYPRTKPMLTYLAWPHLEFSGGSMLFYGVRMMLMSGGDVMFEGMHGFQDIRFTTQLVLSHPDFMTQFDAYIAKCHAEWQRGSKRG